LVTEQNYQIVKEIIYIHKTLCTFKDKLLIYKNVIILFVQSVGSGNIDIISLPGKLASTKSYHFRY